VINKKTLIIISITSLFFVTNMSYSRTQIYAPDDWQYKVMYTSIDDCQLFDQPDDYSQAVDSLSSLEKVVVVRSSKDNFGVGWSKCIYPYKGFIRSKFLSSTDPSQTIDTDLKRRIKIRNMYETWGINETYSETDYAFVKSEPSYTSSNVGVIKDGNKVLLVTDGQNENNLWIKIIYPVEGYILSTDFSISGTNTSLSIAFSFGVVNVPYEKNLSNDFNPIGGMLEYIIPDWHLGIRVGYNYWQSHISDYILKTHLAYLQLRYTFLSFLNNDLETYAAAGGGYWFSSFQNTKYVNLKDYFTEEKDKDLAYTLSAGAIYKFSNFYLDIQYFFVGTREGKFGKEPKTGEFTNQYKLYPAANHVNVFLGYTFRF